MKTITGYFQLLRPANIVTSIADVMAGIAISGFFFEELPIDFKIISVVLLCFSTACLYGGGVVFNDVFDAELDKVERPERPIPRGLITKSNAALLGITLLFAGMLAASAYSFFSGVIAILIATFALIYNRFGKHHSFLGPVNMGLCRGLNLLLGISIIDSALFGWWMLGIIPIIYIASITMISRGEVHGGSKRMLYTGGALYAVVIICIAVLAALNKQLLFTIPALILFAIMIFKPLLAAIDNPEGKNIGKAVKAGVISLIVMNAAWAAAFAQWPLALIILLLLPISLRLAKLFAVT